MNLSLITATHFRSDLLLNHALPSVLKQSDRTFEWIVINDGKDLQTRDVIQSVHSACSLMYLEIDHPAQGFGLCHARNVGLSIATGELVAYLDDDNVISPEFVAQTKAFFQAHSRIDCAMVQQCRQRNTVSDGKMIQKGKSFISPSVNSTVEDLVQMRQLFDSNGFMHRRENAPQWNPNYRVFADYEYFLQCLGVWGRDGFGIQSSVLVDYIQRSDGVIGQSSYKEWAIELKQIIQEHLNKTLTISDAQHLDKQIWKWQNKHNEAISAFSTLKS